MAAVPAVGQQAGDPGALRPPRVPGRHRGVPGRPIEVLPVALGPGTPCGVLVSTDYADYICYPADTTALHAEHILLHEVGHLLCGHEGDAVLEADAVRALVPDLSADLVRRVLGRTGYTQRQEMEAELLATLLARRVRSAGRARGPVSGAAGGLDAIFGAGSPGEITGPYGLNNTNLGGRSDG